MTSDDGENSNWLFDYGLIEGILVPGGELPSLEPSFHWPSDDFAAPNGLRHMILEQNKEVAYVTCQINFFKVYRVGLNDSFGNLDELKEPGSRKRSRSGSCSTADSKPCREKMRRDRLNDSIILEPGRPPKMDKAAMLGDAVRMVTQLRNEALKLKETNDDLQEQITELKAEKNELRDEKVKLKAEKEKLEQQVKALMTQASFLPHPSAIPALFAPPGQVVGSKLVPFIGYPGLPMWQFIPPAAADTSQDQVLHPPVA